MSKSRRQFLTQTSLGLLAAATVPRSLAQQAAADLPPGAPPAFGAGPAVPHGVTLIGRLFDEGTLASAGLALERAFGVAGQRPPGF
jgi:Asp-tRNA(Asn)/Glu-tRNA(Gln) amidotransferase A subunit family amidase